MFQLVDFVREFEHSYRPSFRQSPSLYCSAHTGTWEISGSYFEKMSRDIAEEMIPSMDKILDVRLECIYLGGRKLEI
jgi:hypothetical protein